MYNYRRIFGMPVKDANNNVLGILTDCYKEGCTIVCQINDDHEVTGTRIEEVHDLIRGAAASFVRLI